MEKLIEKLANCENGWQAIEVAKKEFVKPPPIKPQTPKIVDAQVFKKYKEQQELICR